MNDNNETIYDKIKAVLLRYPTIRWVIKSKNGYPLSEEKVTAVNLSFITVLFKFPRLFRLDATVSSINARLALSEAKHNAKHILGWQELLLCYDGHSPIYLLDKASETTGYYMRYVLVRRQLRFMGIKTIVISHDAQN